MKQKRIKTGQKIIKYSSILLALLLIFDIFLSLFNLTSILVTSFTKENKTNYNNEIRFDNLIDVKYLDIDVFASEIQFKTGSNMLIRTNSNYVDCKQEGNRIVLSEKGNKLFYDSSNIEITLPSGLIFEQVELEIAAGKINIESLNTKVFELDNGAGQVVIDTLNVFNETKIDGGVGEIKINNGSLNNLEFNSGVGNVYLKTTLNGNNSFDLGIGSFTLDLNNKLNDLSITTDKGIGSFKVNHKDVKDNTTIGNGNTLITIDGGIGDFSIITKD